MYVTSLKSLPGNRVYATFGTASSSSSSYSSLRIWEGFMQADVCLLERSFKGLFHLI